MAAGSTCPSVDRPSARYSVVLILFMLGDTWKMSEEPQDRPLNYVPEEIAIDASNGPHLTNLGSETNDLDPNVCPRLNHHVRIVRELRWRGIRIVLDFIGH